MQAHSTGIDAHPRPPSHRPDNYNWFFTIAITQTYIRSKNQPWEKHHSIKRFFPQIRGEKITQTKIFQTDPLPHNSIPATRIALFRKFSQSKNTQCHDQPTAFMLLNFQNAYLQKTGNSEQRTRNSTEYWNAYM